MLTILLTALAANDPAEQKAEVRAAVDRFLEVLNSEKRVGFDQVLHADGVAFSMRYIGDQHGVRVRTNRETITNNREPNVRYTERYWDPTIMVHRDVAQFWAPYSFDVDGKRSHCGIDSFSLARIDGKWIVTNGSWTVEPPENCPSLGEPRK